MPETSKDRCTACAGADGSGCAGCAGCDTPDRNAEPERVIFTEEMRKTYTILMPTMLPRHFRIVSRVFARFGYKTEPLEIGLHGDSRPVISYTQPLVYPDGTVYGVIGVELLTCYVQSLLPYSELQNDGFGTYLLARSPDTTQDSSMTLHRVVTSAADSGSSQKRTTSDFTHNDYSLIFRSRGHRMPRKHAFQCSAERSLLYTREV